MRHHLEDHHGASHGGHSLKDKVGKFIHSSTTELIVMALIICDVMLLSTEAFIDNHWACVNGRTVYGKSYEEFVAMGQHPDSTDKRIADVPMPHGPMPVVDHDKEAGGGYTKGSPLYNKQQRRLKKNEQLVKGDLKKAKPRAAEKESEEPDLQKDAMKVVTGKMGAYDYYYRYPKTTISSLLCYILITVLVGYIYHSNFRGGLGMRKYQPYEGDSFSYNLLDCRNCRTDMPICCMAWCCPVVRWAATVSTDKVPLIGFWAALFVCLFLTGFSSFTFGITGILWLCVAVHYRQSLREYFGHGRYLESPSLVFLDCLTWVCCPCCAIVQEAREVEKAQPVLMVQPIGAPTGQAPGMTTSAQAPGTMQPSLRAGSQH